jgi:type III restriction enzyme
MRLALKDFQTEAVDRLRLLAGHASSSVELLGPQTLVLAAPTGSGKTVMAAAWMEHVLEGDESHAPDSNATFLWLTDQPELNEQTRRKLYTSSTTFTGYKLITIDAAFHAEVFEAGSVYFLNTQKLGRNASLVQRGDHRTYTLWDTIANTAAQRPESFWVVIDEAHRGMVENVADAREARTIVQKFIKGSEGEIPPMPLVLGISATPDRFTSLLAGTTVRSTSPVVSVDPNAVRASGLLKDAITLYHPLETQPSDLTLLRAAAEQLKRYDSEWEAYATKEAAPSVRPVLVIQVEDASATKVTKSDLGACLSVVEDALGPLDDAAVGHSFQEGHPVVVGDDRRLRYVAPADIQDDTDLKVVFFKRSLTTGWDCPRAEVMMSFRKAVDQTLIAQLVGRMVRTPLARSVSGSELLSSVCLYLPYYDEDALDAVIGYLSEPDPEIGFPTRVQRGEELVTLERNEAVAEAFDAAEQLITYVVEKATKQSSIRRLLRLGRLLAWDKLDTDAPGVFTAALVAELAAERAKVVGSEEFAERLADAASIDVRAVTVAYGGTEKTAVKSTQLVAVAGNVEHAFAEAGRKLGGGLHSSYLNLRAVEDDAPPVPAIKLELYALLQDPAVPKSVEERAGEVLSRTLEQHKVAIRALPDERRQHYRHIRRQAAAPEPEPWELPDSIEGFKDGNTKLDRHMYVTDAGTHACTLNSWERSALNDALDDPGAVGWLRNDPRKPWSFTVPYQIGSEFKPMYPDLLVFRRQGGGLVCDILEPHSPDFADTVAKAKGLAVFARDHGDEFGRIRLIAKFGNSYKAIALDDIDTRDKVLGVATKEHLDQLFDAV